MSTKQQTLKGPISFSGKGLHTGVEVTMTVNPAGVDNGIVFRRIDVEGTPLVPALCDNVTDTSRGTTIESNGVKVSTIEHIMSALWTLGVDNALIDIATGLVEQDADRKYYQVTEKMVYTIPDKGVSIILYPDEEFSASVHVDYNSKVIGNQYATFLPDDDYAAKIAPCRTFVFLHELEPLFKMNLIKGGDLDNAIVVVENPVSDEQLTHLKQIFHKEDICITGGYLNNLELRFTTDKKMIVKLTPNVTDITVPARAAVESGADALSMINTLLGMRIKGRVWASRPGHFANTEFMKQLRRTIRKEGERPRYKYDCRKTPVYDINDIRRMLPHRPPFLLVDRIFHVDDNSIAGIKNVTMNEPFFVGHFPNEPVMPGVLIVEAMAQCGGIMVLRNIPDPENYSTYFMKIDGVKFKRKIIPGDTLQFELHLTEPIRRGVCVMDAKAFVGDTLACEATLMAQVAKTKK